MPNKHKNRKKSNRPQTYSSLPTPPATPISDCARHSEQPSTQVASFPSPPVTPNDLAPEGAFIPYCRNDCSIDLDELHADMIQVWPRPADSFPAPTLDFSSESEAIIPVDYHHWPSKTSPGILDDQSISDNKWKIGQRSLRSVVTGVFDVTSEVPGRSLAFTFMMAWLSSTADLALDVAFDRAEWMSVCENVWQTMALKGGDERILQDNLVQALLNLGSFTTLVIRNDAGHGMGLLDIGYQRGFTPTATATIQHQPVHATKDSTELHPVHGPITRVIHTEDEAVVRANICKDISSLCTIVDINNKMLPTPVSFYPAPRQASLDFYATHPIHDHVQSLPPLSTIILGVEGERVWTSTEEVANLEAILVKHLVWPKRHRGRSLLCRVLTRPLVNGGISFLVEDSDSQVIPVTVMYPLPQPAIVYKPSMVQTLWPVGTCLYIKEPYARMGAKGRTEILIAWPKDMVEVPRVAGIFDHPAVVPATSDLGAYRLAAAVAFKQNKVKLAIRLASVGLNLASLPHLYQRTEDDHSQRISLLVGRALLYWLNDQQGAAFSDCLKVESLIGSSVSSHPLPLWRRIQLIRLRSAYKLRMFSIADQQLAVCEHLGFHSSILDPYRVAIKLRLEETKGVFSSKPISPSLGSERALYVGPIKVVVDAVKGRRVVTTRAVSSGEVLLVETDMAGVNHHGSRGVLMATILSGRNCVLSASNHTSCTVHQIMDDPSVGQCMHSLAPNMDFETSNLGFTDEERLEAFKNPREIEVNLLRRQLGRNVYGEGDTFSLYGLGSMFSHSCQRNVIKVEVDRVNCALPDISSIADVQAECHKAVNDMIEGEEIFTNYVVPTRPFDDRHATLLRNWFFECDCSLCTADKSAGDRHRVRAEMMDREWPLLWAEADALIMSSQTESQTFRAKRGKILARLTAFASMIDATYAVNRSAKLELSQITFIQGDLCASSDRAQSLKYYQAGFRHMEWVLFTAEEMKKTKKAIRRYGFVQGDHIDEAATRLSTMADLYRSGKQYEAEHAVRRSIYDLYCLCLSPTVAPPSFMPPLAKRSTGVASDAIIDEVTAEIKNHKPGDRVEGALSQEALAKMFTVVTLPNGRKVMETNFKGTTMEGQEEFYHEQMARLQSRMKGAK